MNGQLETKEALIYDPLAPMPRTADSIQFMEPVFNDPKIGEDGTCTVRFQVLIPDSVNPQPERKWYVNDQAGFQMDSLNRITQTVRDGRPITDIKISKNPCARAFGGRFQFGLGAPSRSISLKTIIS